MHHNRIHKYIQMSNNYMPGSTQVNFSAKVNITSPQNHGDEDESKNEKVKKLRTHSVASEITEELKKQKINRKG